MAKRWFVWKNLKTTGRSQVYAIHGESLEEAWTSIPSGPIDQVYTVVEANKAEYYTKELVLKKRGESK